MKLTSNYIEKKFDELVPEMGPAPTVAGEIVRAVCRIAYRFYNDGDKIAVGYGAETCNAAARYLYKKCGDNADIISAINDMWGNDYDNSYQHYLTRLIASVANYIETHSELETTPNTIDMFDYTLDCDYEREEEEEEEKWWW